MCVCVKQRIKRNKIPPYTRAQLPKNTDAGYRAPCVYVCVCLCVCVCVCGMRCVCVCVCACVRDEVGVVGAVRQMWGLAHTIPRASFRCAVTRTQKHRNTHAQLHTPCSTAVRLCRTAVSYGCVVRPPHLYVVGHACGGGGCFLVVLGPEGHGDAQRRPRAHERPRHLRLRARQVARDVALARLQRQLRAGRCVGWGVRILLAARTKVEVGSVRGDEDGPGQ